MKLNADGPTVRGYEHGDASRIRELTLEGFDGVSIDQNADRLLGIDSLPDWQTRKWLAVQRELEDAPDDHFVAVIDGDVVGYITTRPVQETGVGHIPNMAVDARLRRRGIGSALITRALEHLRVKGMRVAKIETLEQNKQGQTLYPSFGFTEVARQIHYMRPLDND
jgi:ribosomal protein S18 acetylase RimI-like enzyme